MPWRSRATGKVQKTTTRKSLGKHCDKELARQLGRAQQSVKMKRPAKGIAQSPSLHAGESRWKKSWSTLGILSFVGHRSAGSTRRALARQINSKSATHRSCVSIFASVSRLRSQPHRRQRAASIGCVKPCWLRSLRICGPTKLRGFFMSRSQNRNRRKERDGKGSEFRTKMLKIALAISGLILQKLMCGNTK